MKKIIFTILAFLPLYFATAQSKADSLASGTTLEELFTVCNSVLPEGENPNEIIFERLSSYVLYTGTDEARKNASACDYNKTEDRKLVDIMGHNLKNWLDKISDFKVLKYQLSKKDNIEWHSITVSYKPINGGKNKTFSFLKVKDKFLLGKIE